MTQQKFFYYTDTDIIFLVVIIPNMVHLYWMSVLFPVYIEGCRVIWHQVCMTMGKEHLSTNAALALTQGDQAGLKIRQMFLIARGATNLIHC